VRGLIPQNLEQAQHVYYAAIVELPKLFCEKRWSKRLNGALHTFNHILWHYLCEVLYTMMGSEMVETRLKMKANEPLSFFAQKPWMLNRQDRHLKNISVAAKAVTGALATG